MANTSTALTATPSARIFRTIRFTPDLAPYADYDRIATTAREIGGHFRVLNHSDGAITVELFWLDASDEAR